MKRLLNELIKIAPIDEQYIECLRNAIIEREYINYYLRGYISEDLPKPLI